MLFQLIIILLFGLFISSGVARYTMGVGFGVLNIDLFKKLVFNLLVFVFFILLYMLIIFKGTLLTFDTGSYYIFLNEISWLGYKHINFNFGVDGLSYFFILLTALLIPVCLVANWRFLTNKLSEVFIYLLIILEILLFLTFSILDIFLFYIFFESVLIPMFFLIGIWGSRNRRIKASYYFFLYTLVGSLLMLLGIISIYLEVGSTNLFIVLEHGFSYERQLFLWLMFFIAFAVKTPIYPFHIWLPEAHVEAPTTGSVILAGILLKLGGYGLIRFSLPLFPAGMVYFAPLAYTLCILGVIYASLTTLRQIDLKKIIAYSSIAHMNFGLLGLFALNQQGLEGCVFLMLGHGLVSSALFLLVGVLYDRHHTRLLQYYGGLAQVMPLFATIFLFFTLANIGFPGTSNFIGEILVLFGLIQQNAAATFFISFGLVLGASYAFFLYNRVCFGTLKVQYIKNFKDLTRYECYALVPLVFLTIVLGVFPNIILTYLHLPVLEVLHSKSYFVG